MVDDNEREAWNEMVERAKKGDKVTREEVIERAPNIWSEQKSEMENLKDAISRLIGDYCEDVPDGGWILYTFPFEGNEHCSTFIGKLPDSVEDLPKLLRELADKFEKGEGCY